MKYQDWWESLNVHLLCRGLGPASRTVQCLQTCQVLEGIGDVVDIGLANIKLKRLVRFQRNGSLFTGSLVFRAQLATEYLRDRALNVNGTRVLRDSGLLLMSDFFPAAVNRS